MKKICLFLIPALFLFTSNLFEQIEIQQTIEILEEIKYAYIHNVDICNPKQFPKDRFTESSNEYYEKCQEAYERIMHAVYEIDNAYEQILIEQDHLDFNNNETILTTISPP